MLREGLHGMDLCKHWMHTRRSSWVCHCIPSYYGVSQSGIRHAINYHYCFYLKALQNMTGIVNTIQCFETTLLITL